MYKAKIDLVVAEKNFEKGKLYTAEEVAHLDPNDFEFVGEAVEAVEAEKTAETVVDAEVVAETTTAETVAPTDETATAETATDTTETAVEAEKTAAEVLE